MPTTASENRLPLPNDPKTAVAHVSVTWDPAASTRGAGGAWRRIASRLRSNWWAPVDAVVAALSMLLAHGSRRSSRATRWAPSRCGRPHLRRLLRAPGLHRRPLRLGRAGPQPDDPGAARRCSARWWPPASPSASSTSSIYRPIGRWVVALAVALTVPLVLGPHVYVLVQLQRRRRRVLVHGGRSPLTDRMVEAFENERRALCQVVGRWTPDDAHRRNGDDLVDLARSPRRGRDRAAHLAEQRPGRRSCPRCAACPSAAACGRRPTSTRTCSARCPSRTVRRSGC